MNAVEKYLKNHGSYVSTNKLSKQLNISRRNVTRQVLQSTHLKEIDPLLVGSNKQFVRIFRYFEYPKEVENVSYASRRYRNINLKKILQNGNSSINQEE